MSRSMSAYQQQTRPFTSAVWAVDPVESEMKIDPGTIAEMAQWTGSGRMVIHPAYVFTPVTSFEKLAADTVAQAVQNYVSGLKIDTEKAAVVVRPELSISAAAHALIEFNHEQGGDLIIVSSHGRKGLPRIVFGSFAERVLRSSPVPILCLNQNPRPPGASMRKALFASDFGTQSERAFTKFLEEAAGLVHEIVLFHDFTISAELALFGPRWGYTLPSAYGLIEVQLEALEATASEWIAKAQEKGYSAVFAQAKNGAPVSQTILEAARSFLAGWIVMSADLGPFSSLIFGSNARDMIQASEFPVLLYGPKTTGEGGG